MKVILITAITLDGKIARSRNDSLDWTSKEDKKFFAQETKKAGVVVMGDRTFKILKKPLAGRLQIVYTRTPQKYHSIKGRLEYTNLPPEKLLSVLKKRGFKTIFIAGGRSIYTLFAKENLLTEIWLTIEPRVFGGGISLFSNSVDLKLKLKEKLKLNQDTFVLKYQCKS